MKIEIKKKELFKKLTSPSGESRTTFKGIEERFSDRLHILEKETELLKIDKYFGKNIGVKSSHKLLVKNEILEESCFEDKLTKTGKFKYRDFKGLYVFYSGKKPFYVGISRSVINRIQQHVKTGKSHYSASMAYRIACLQHEMNGSEVVWRREDLSYKDNIEPVQTILRKKNIKVVPIQNDEDLYLFEVYCSITYDTLLNKFSTH
jgi:hypothetical protein